MINQAPEDFIRNLVETYDLAPANEKFYISLSDMSALAEAGAVLRSRSAEIAELNALADKLDRENGQLKERIASHTVDVAEWQTTIRELTIKHDDYVNNSVHRDRVREVLNMVQFALEAAQRAFAMPIEVEQSLTGIWEEARSQLLYQPNDDIPF